MKANFGGTGLLLDYTDGECQWSLILAFARSLSVRWKKLHVPLVSLFA